MNRLILLRFFRRHLWPKLHPATNNPVRSDCSRAKSLRRRIEIIARVRLAQMSGEGAAKLRLEVIWVLLRVLEVVVAEGIGAQGGVILGWSEIDWRSCGDFRN